VPVTASAETLLDIVRHVPAMVERLLLVGHNPGIEELALRLARRDGDRLRGELEVKYPTGTVAEIGLPAENWADVLEGTGRIVRFIRPRDLDPELGPDAE
jgi:phosphohistidine phosphatase